MEMIGETIRKRRRQLGITQQTLAMLAGVGINTVVAIERGSNSASLATLMKVLDCLGLDLTLTIREMPVNGGQ